MIAGVFFRGGLVGCSYVIDDFGFCLLHLFHNEGEFSEITDSEYDSIEAQVTGHLVLDDPCDEWPIT